MPDFSIIIPCHNYGRFLRTAIDSILAQSLQDYEIIVVNDASTDDTEKIVMDYGDRIKYIHIKKNIGPGPAWVEGIKHVNGKYICKLDADDWLLNDFLVNTKKIFEKDQHIGIVVSSAYDYLERENSVKLFSVSTTNKELKAHEFRIRLLKEFFMRMPSTVLRLEAIKNTGLPIADLYIGHDWEYFLRISKNWKCFLLEKPGAVYRLHSMSVTKNSARSNRIIKDFQFWLDVSSKKSTPHYINKKERRVLALAMAKTYLRIQGVPNYKVLFSHQYPWFVINAIKLAAKGSPLIVPSIILFVLRGIAIVLKRKILPTNTKIDNEALSIKFLLPNSGYQLIRRCSTHEQQNRMLKAT